MFESIQSQWGNYVVSNVVALLLIGLAAKRPKVARFFL
jgi:hypothetical protein